MLSSQKSQKKGQKPTGRRLPVLKSSITLHIHTGECTRAGVFVKENDS